MEQVEQWGTLELSFTGKTQGNPYVDYDICGHFQGACEQLEAEGFYDGEGTYRIRFMPSFTGTYTYKVKGSFSEEIYEGSFQVTEPSRENHGPVKVADQYHFTYSDGTPYYEIGTTCYAWVHQELAMQEKTLETLKNSPFNKLRFCIFPKHYDYNLYEPLTYPYEGHAFNPDNSWDFTRFNPKHFQLFDKRIKELCELGIEADIILFHPYDRWGFSTMSQADDDRYVRYMTARYSAYRNIWWSLANEYDILSEKTIGDWDRLGTLVCKKDPYHHLRSIHNCKKIYDFTKPWITHCSIQRTEIYLSSANTEMWRLMYGKPVVLDEVGYEGNINFSWGNLTAEEMVRQFWLATVRGGYCGHGETYLHPDDKLWWSHGGVLYGESSPRLQFLHELLKEVPGLGLEPAHMRKCEDDCATASHIKYKGRYYLYYSGNTRPGFKQFDLTPGKRYHVEVIDTWNMTIEDRGICESQFTVTLPSRLYMVVRICEEQ